MPGGSHPDSSRNTASGATDVPQQVSQSSADVRDAGRRHKETARAAAAVAVAALYGHNVRARRLATGKLANEQRRAG